MKLVQRYIVLTLAMLLTLSASGLTLSLHKCCGSIKDFSLFGSSKSCSMEKKAEPSACKLTGSTTIKHQGKSCCQDQTITVQETSEATVSKAPATEKKNFDVLLILNMVRDWFGYSKQNTREEGHIVSPAVLHSLIILFRQFRI